MWVEKTRKDGSTFWGVARTTFVINERGKVIKAFPQVKVEGHSAEVLRAVRGS